MLKTILTATLLLAFSGTLYAKDKSDRIEDAIRDEIRDELGYDDKKGKNKGNPGAHGRENAREKQCDNPGKGSKCDGDLLDDLRDEFDDDDDKGKNKNKNKNKNKK